MLTKAPVFEKGGERRSNSLGLRGTQFEISSDFAVGEALFGFYRSPPEFVEAAMQAKHPLDFASNIPDILMTNIAGVLADGPALTNARRKLEILKVRKLKMQLQQEEEELHKSLHPEVQKILQGKNLLLWKHLMQSTGFDDPTLFEEVTSGFKLVGQPECSPQFPKGFVPMHQSPQELRSKSVWMRKANAAKCVSTGDIELDSLVWTQTLEECTKGWMEGPYTEDQVTERVGSTDWLATRRFPLQQKDKVRMIDDALASGLNSAYGTSNKLVLFDVDTLTSLALEIAKAVKLGYADFQLSDGQKVEATVSPSWPTRFSLLGRTLDLSSAYKQLCPCAGDVWNRIIMAFDPNTRRPAYFVSSALMFGSVAAVYGFNRVSRSLWHIMAVLLRLWHTVCYDDFPSLESAETSETALDCSSQLLKLLGWEFAAEGHKALPYASRFDALGITIDSSQAAEGRLTLCNKESRTQSLSQMMLKILDDGRLEPGMAASLHGQLNFSQGQYMGSPLKPAMKFFSQVASSGWTDQLRPALAMAGSFVHTILRTSRPRTIDIGAVQTPILLFTDGAWEAKSECPAGAGIVMIDPVSNLRLVQEVTVPPELVQHWRSLGKAQLIAELELLPAVVAFEAHKEIFQHRRVLLFVDNNAIRDAIAKASSPSISVFVLLSELNRIWSEPAVPVLGVPGTYQIQHS